MRVIVIALMLFFLNLSVVMLDTLGIYNYNIAAEDQWRTEVDAAKAERFDPDVGVDAAVSFGFGDFVSGFKTFVAMIWRVINIGETLILFGVDSTIANTFGLAGAVLYFLGIAQFIANRGTKGMQ